jgi:dihydropteroate synthase
MKGAKILRVHDVRATVEALKVVAAVQKNNKPPINADEGLIRSDKA